VLTRLTFVDEVKACSNKKPVSDLLALNYIRNLAEEVGKKYDKTFNVYRHVVPSDYVGIRCETDEQIAKVVEEMFLASYPQIFDKYVEFHLRKRPMSVRVIYAVGDLGNYDAFVRLGISEITQTQLDAHIGDANLEKQEKIQETSAETIESLLKEEELEKHKEGSTFSKFFKNKNK
jgi:hypothetical protein